MTDSAYFVSPLEGPGPGVLLLHSWWGLLPSFRRLADRLADSGYTVLVPDLSVGETFETEDAASRHLGETDVDRLASLVLTSSKLLQEKSSSDRIGAVGFSMGASLALWASVRLPDTIGAVSAFYGTQAIDFTGADATYQLHLAGSDDMVTDDEAAFMQATMGLENLEVETWIYPESQHWFFESGRPEFDPEASDQAWDRLLTFLSKTVASVSET